MEKLLDIKNLSISFCTNNGKANGVRDISFHLNKGETLAVVGESGSGKTVTVRAIIGLLSPNAIIEAGEIIYEGTDLLKLSDKEFCKLRGNRISMIFQDPYSSLNPIVKVGKQITEAMMVNCTMTKKEAKERAIKLIEEVGITSASRIYNQYPFELSGGMRQRIVIAIALSSDPDVLICDEPTSALDEATETQILELINILKKKRNLSVIFITHDLKIVSNLSDRIVVIGEDKKKSVKLNKVIKAYNDEVLLDVQHLKKYFKDRHVIKAVDDVSFQIHKGEVLGVVGKSGCGKTTIGRTIMNIYEATGGKVYFDGQCISIGIQELKKEYKRTLKYAKKATTKEEAEEIRIRAKCILDEIAEGKKINKKYNSRKINKMQMIFQDPIASLNPRMTVGEIIAEGLEIRNVKDEEYINKRVLEVLELVGLLPEHANRYPHEFSGGQCQRIGIARAIVLEPKLIIADEPVSALDASNKAQIINLLNELRDKMGLAIMFIAHDLSIVEHFSDRVVVMNDGKLVEHK